MKASSRYLDSGHAIAASSIAGQRIGLLTASASRLGGGVSEAVIGQALLLAELGAEPRVFALEDHFSEADRPRFGEVEVEVHRVAGPSQIGYAPSLLRGLMAAKLDCLHLHGIWMYPSAAGVRWALKSGGAYLISPHGMLDPWITSRGRWKKELARAGYERRSWRRATRWHALTEAEAIDIEAESGRTADIIPNWAPSPSLPTPTDRGSFIYLGRIHPKKNLTALLEAWGELYRKDALGSAQLTIAGWGNERDVAALKAALVNAPNSVSFIGPVHGDQKQALLDKARYLILPSLSEGLPMVILEAWASGTPTIMTPHCHLDEGVTAGAALRCGADQGSITVALMQALSLDETQWGTMAKAARQLVAGPFARATIAGQWAAAYTAAIGQVRHETLREGGPDPQVGDAT